MANCKFLWKNEENNDCNLRRIGDFAVFDSVVSQYMVLPNRYLELYLIKQDTAQHYNLT